MSDVKLNGVKSVNKDFYVSKMSNGLENLKEAILYKDINKSISDELNKNTIENSKEEINLNNEIEGNWKEITLSDITNEFVSEGLKRNQKKLNIEEDGLYLTTEQVDYIIQNTDFELHKKNGTNIFLINYLKNNKIKLTSEQVDYIIKNTDLKTTVDGEDVLLYIIKNGDRGLLTDEQFEYILKNSNLDVRDKNGFCALRHVLRSGKINDIDFGNKKINYHGANSNYIQKNCKLSAFQKNYLIENTNLKEFTKGGRSLFMEVIGNRDLELTTEQWKFIIENTDFYKIAANTYQILNDINKDYIPLSVKIMVADKMLNVGRFNLNNIITCTNIINSKNMFLIIPEEIKKILNINEVKDLECFAEDKKVIFRAFGFTKYNKLTKIEEGEIIKELDKLYEGRSVVERDIRNSVFLPFNSNQELLNEFNLFKIKINEKRNNIETLRIASENLILNENEYSVEYRKIELEMVDLFNGINDKINNYHISNINIKNVNEEQNNIFISKKIELDVLLVMEKIEFNFEKIKKDFLQKNEIKIDDEILKGFQYLCTKESENFSGLMDLNNILNELKSKKYFGLFDYQIEIIEKNIGEAIPKLINYYNELESLNNETNKEDFLIYKDKINNTIKDLIPNLSEYTKKFEEFREKEKEKILTRIRENQSGKLDVNKSEFKNNKVI